MDPQAEIVLQELATQYENLIDQALNIGQDGGAQDGNKSGPLGASNQSRQLKDKDREIKQLRQQLAQAQSGIGNGSENGILRNKVKQLE